MLKFNTLKTQINRMVEESKDLEDEYSDKVLMALRELSDKSRSWESLAEKVDKSKTSWLVAGFDEPLNKTYPLVDRPPSYRAVSSDGSQIFPDRHEAIPCYLINTSKVVLNYGDNAGAVLDSDPTLFYKDEDRYVMWDGKKVYSDQDAISMKRTMMELGMLAELAEQNRSENPTIALSDGTLILWKLEATPRDFKETVLAQLISIMDKLQEIGVPIAGYISHPGSTDVVNALRLGLCPETTSFCNQCPYTDLPQLPCAPIEGITDRLLYSNVLKEGERSAVFKSASKILSQYGPHHVHFFYINVGDEIARVEVPEWVARDRDKLDLVHALIFDQAKKGSGYPVALSEAHEKAVVRGRDREFFFELVRDALMTKRMKVNISRKGISKRSPGI